MDIHTEMIVDAPASDAWRLLGEQFAEIAEWAVGIEASSLEGELGVGAVRTCDGAGWGPFPPGQVSEQLTHFDRSAMAFTYVGTEGLPGFVSTAMNRWSIEALGPSQCRVRSHATVVLAWWARPLGPLFRLMLRSPMKQFGEEVTHRIVEGRPHPRKVASG